MKKNWMLVQQGMKNLEKLKKNRIHAKYVAIVVILLTIYWLSFCYQCIKIFPHS